MRTKFAQRAVQAAISGAALLLATSHPSLGQDLPTRPIIVITPYGGGGSVDFSLRTIAHKVEEQAKLTVVIENRAGGGGTVAAQAVKTSPPDGTRLMLVDAGTFASNVTLFANLSYSPLTDFKPITPLWYIQNVLAVAEESPMNSLADLVAYGRKKSDGLTYASPAVGASGHLLGTMLAKATKISMTNVPYRGALAAATEVAAGRVDFCFCSYSTIRGLVDGKKLKIIAIAGPNRNALLPNVPTTVEAGFPDLIMDVWFGIAAPVGTPDATVAALNKVFTAAASSPDVKEKLASQDVQVMADTPAGFKALIAKEIDRYRPIVLESGARVN